jgi:hypothetical protein
MAGQTAHPKTRDWVAGQLLAIRITELLHVHLGRTECVKAQNSAWRRIVDQDIDRADAFGVLLRSVLVQVIVERRDAAPERRAIMPPGV